MSNRSGFALNETEKQSNLMCTVTWYYPLTAQTKIVLRKATTVLAVLVLCITGNFNRETQNPWDTIFREFNFLRVVVDCLL